MRHHLITGPSRGTLRVIRPDPEALPTISIHEGNLLIGRLRPSDDGKADMEDAARNFLPAEACTDSPGGAA